jgi:hypothetical protein
MKVEVFSGAAGKRGENRWIKTRVSIEVLSQSWSDSGYRVISGDLVIGNQKD